MIGQVERILDLKGLSRDILPLQSTTPQEWDAQRQLRLERVDQIISFWGNPPWLNRIYNLGFQIHELLVPGLYDRLFLSDRGGDIFVQTHGEDLRKLCKLRGQETLRRSQGGPDSWMILLSSRLPDGYFLFSHQKVVHLHTPSTILAANYFLTALVPNANLTPEATYSRVMTKVNELSSNNSASIDPSETWLEFATILPGVTVGYGFGNRANPIITVQINLTGKPMPPFNWPW